MEDGIPQSNANDIIQDTDGYLWFATQKGASRFDGKTFTSLTEKEGLISNIVLNIFQDSRGAMWFGTRFGLSKYENKKFTNYTTHDGLPSNLIHKIVEDENEIIYIATHNGLCMVRNDSLIVLPDFRKIILSILPGNKNNIWVGTNEGLYNWQENQFTPVIGFPEIEIIDIEKDHDDHLWIASKNGIYKFTQDTIIHFDQKNGLHDQKVEDLMVDSNNHVWMASEGRGLCRYDGISFHYYNQSNGFNNLSVFKIYEDFEKNIWVGGRNGLTIYNRRIPFAHYEFDDELKYSDFFGMTQDTDSNYWFTTYGNGIVKFDGKNYQQFTEKTGLPDNRFFTVIEDQRKNLWFGSASAGVIRYDGKNFTHFMNKGLPPCRVFNVVEDVDGNLWLATQEFGVIKYDGRRFEKMNQKLGIPVEISITVFEDSRHNIWMSLIGVGVYKYIADKQNPSKDTVIAFNSKNGLSPNYIRCITEDQNGYIWLGTSSHGVIRIIEGDTVTYQNVREKDGLKSDNVYFMKFDRHGRLWIGTEKGIDRLQFDKDYNIISVKNYQKAQGFLGIETALNGVMEDHDGALWFGTVAGVAKYLEENDQTNQQPPITHINSVKLFYQDTDWSEYSDSLDRFNLPRKLTLPYDRNHLTFEFIGICLSNPEQVRYQFMLDGFDKTYSPILNKNEAVYTSLPPGEYTFMVKSSNDDLVWNDHPATFAFIIAPPVWQRPWFILAILLTISGTIIMMVKWRLYELKKTKKTLEFKVKERTGKILQQNEEISKQKEEIERKNSVLEFQNMEIAIKNKDITDSISYAQRIQNAMLPKEEKLQALFADSFVLFKPKAIVSGDFFWFSRKKDKIIIATVDCTGHGIPGAFMAMIGDSLLSQIINQNEVLLPDQILKQLNKGVQSALNQEDNENTDGMDIAICVIDKKTRKLAFSGAKSSLMYFENDTQYIIKGSRNPIGSTLFESPTGYQSHEVPITDQTRFYMYTDGYQDQFGGCNNKKFMIKRFRSLIHELHLFPFSHQKKRLDCVIEDWKEDNEQIDDILVLGFKVF